MRKISQEQRLRRQRLVAFLDGAFRVLDRLITFPEGETRKRESDQRGRGRADDSVTLPPDCSLAAGRDELKLLLRRGRRSLWLAITPMLGFGYILAAQQSNFAALRVFPPTCQLADARVLPKSSPRRFRCRSQEQSSRSSKLSCGREKCSCDAPAGAALPFQEAVDAAPAAVFSVGAPSRRSPSYRYPKRSSRDLR